MFQCLKYVCLPPNISQQICTFMLMWLVGFPSCCQACSHTCIHYKHIFRWKNPWNKCLIEWWTFIIFSSITMLIYVLISFSMHISKHLSMHAWIHVNMQRYMHFCIHVSSSEVERELSKESIKYIHHCFLLVGGLLKSSAP